MDSKAEIDEDAVAAIRADASAVNLQNITVNASRGGHGVRPAVVIAEMQQAGFRLIDRIEWTGSQYCLVFENPGA